MVAWLLDALSACLAGIPSRRSAARAGGRRDPDLRPAGAGGAPGQQLRAAARPEERARGGEALWRAGRAGLARQAVRALQGAQVREGARPAQELRVQGLSGALAGGEGVGRRQRASGREGERLAVGGALGQGAAPKRLAHAHAAPVRELRGAARQLGRSLCCMHVFHMRWLGRSVLCAAGLLAAAGCVNTSTRPLCQECQGLSASVHAGRRAAVSSGSPLHVLTPQNLELSDCFGLVQYGSSKHAAGTLPAPSCCCALRRMKESNVARLT